MTNEDEWLTEEQASEILMSTAENVRRMVWSGRISGEKIADSRAYRISARSVRRLVEEGGYIPGMTQPGE